MNKEEKTEWGFTRGKVARELRQILYKDFDDKEVETIVVVLLCHLLIDSRLNDLIYELLIYDLPQRGGKDSEEENKKLNDEMKNKVWSNVKKMQLIRKLEMVEPALKIWFEHLPGKIRDINRVRNDIFHGRKSKDNVIFEGRSIWEEDTLEKYFISSQSCSEELSKFYEMMDGNRAVREKWAKRLEKLGEPLF